jgi:hypothetical protein
MPPAAIVVCPVELDATELAHVGGGARSAASPLMLGARARLVVEVLPQRPRRIDRLEEADAMVAHPAAAVDGALAVEVDAPSVGATSLKVACVHGTIL